LLVHRGIWITGVVVDPDGGPVDSVNISASTAGESTLQTDGQSNSEGLFSLGPLAPGSYRLSINFVRAPGLAAPEPRFVDAGARDVRLELVGGGSFSVQLVDGLTGAKVNGRVSIAEGGGFARSAAGGSAHKAKTFNGLLPGRYSIVGLTDDGRLGSAPSLDLKGGDELGPIEVPLYQGGELSVLYTGPEEYSTVEVLLDDVRYQRTPAKSGTALPLYAPAGDVTVRFTRRLDLAGETGKREKVVHEQVIVVRPGELVEVRYRVD